ncbi:hypothetical protein SVAN01_00651 [Stagonosporopsis vannaccii]|nr:hypothetical protein SVAN01_00651 [Stagonosporopsis vannaccii]
MSNPASFWAARSKRVESHHAQADVSAPSAQREPVYKNAHPMKSILYPPQSQYPIDKLGGDAIGVKKPKWADSDDEEDVSTSIISSERIQELEKTLIAKNARIADLSVLSQEKEVRIAELESAFEKQGLRLTKLEGAVEDIAARIEELNKRDDKHVFHGEQLVADVDEKGRRIVALETEIHKQCARIAELDQGDSSTQVSSHDTPDSPTDSLIDATARKIKVKEYVVGSTQQAMQLKAVSELGGRTAITPPRSPSPHSVTAAGPAINLSTFPIFATPSTIKQTAPPPPAPKLKMPVDLSKFVKEPTTKPTARKNKTNAVVTGARKDGPVPDVDPSLDIRTKSLEERTLFANGPEVQVKMGEIALAIVPKYALMQCSSKAFKYFSENPHSTSFHLPGSSMDIAAATAHLAWMNEMTYQNRVYSITLHSDEKFDDKNLEICRAARVLGFNNMYVGHFTKIFCDRIRSNTVSDGFLSKIAAAAYPENDPIYDCLANNLANLRLRGTAQNPAAIEELLQRNDGLKTKVENIEERMRKKHDGFKPVKGPKLIHVGKKVNV